MGSGAELGVGQALEEILDQRAMRLVIPQEEEVESVHAGQCTQEWPA
jgi:hypothetical protein